VFDTQQERPAAVRQLVRRVGWGVADQGVSSLGNFVLGVVAAHNLSATEFGAFSLAFVTFSFVLSGSRGASTDPLMVRFSGADPVTWRPAVAAASGTAWATGLAVGMVCLLLGLLLPWHVGAGFVGLAVGLPGILLQDSYRFAFFSCGRGDRAFRNDLIWTLLQMATLGVLVATDSISILTCMLAFSLTATAAAWIGLLQIGIRPRVSLVRRWLVDHRSLGVRYLVENVSIGGARQARFFAVGAIVGLAAVGQIRGAEILMGPFVIVLAGVAQVSVPEAKHVLDREPRRLSRFCVLLASSQAAAALCWGAAVVVLPVGRLLLGDLWDSAHELLVPVFGIVVLGCYENAAAAGLRAMGFSRRSLTAQLTSASCYLVGGTVGAFVGGALGSCWGVVAAQLIGLAMWWYQLRRGISDHVAALPEGDRGWKPQNTRRHSWPAGEEFDVFAALDQSSSLPSRAPKRIGTDPHVRRGEDAMTARPRVTIGLPVYNGEEYLEQALDGLLAQTFTDFELIISDNASTDRTAEICQQYAGRDPRIRYVRQKNNIGAGPNHNVLVPMARGQYFKWASHDDVYAPELIERCVEALETHPEVVLAHVHDGLINAVGAVTALPRYSLDTSSREAHVRLRSLLRVNGGNDFYGVIPTEILRSIKPHHSYHHADRTFMAQLILKGPFVQVPEVLFFRRDHPGRASRGRSTRQVAATLDPRRSDRFRHPLIRLYTEYVAGFLGAVWRAPISVPERLRCTAEVAAWFVGRLRPGRARALLTHGGEHTLAPIVSETGQNDAS
jgi:glycosyltransferase involved in cell wall biosynthesis/O-antigen/teichoic acid export membrane protein